MKKFFRMSNVMLAALCFSQTPVCAFPISPKAAFQQVLTINPKKMAMNAYGAAKDVVKKHPRVTVTITATVVAVSAACLWVGYQYEQLVQRVENARKRELFSGANKNDSGALSAQRAEIKRMSQLPAVPELQNRIPVPADSRAKSMDQSDDGSDVFFDARETQPKRDEGFIDRFFCMPIERMVAALRSTSKPRRRIPASPAQATSSSQAVVPGQQAI